MTTTGASNNNAGTSFMMSNHGTKTTSNTTTTNNGIGAHNGNGLRYYTQIACKNRHGNMSSGKKVTGLAFIRKPKISRMDAINSSRSNESGNSEQQYGFSDFLLVTTNDSRMRLYSMDDFCMRRKYKGLTIDHVICGSESGHVYIWDTNTQKTGGKHPHDNNNNGGSSSPRRNPQKSYERVKSCEWFEAISRLNHPTPVITDAHFVKPHILKTVLLESNLFPVLKRMNDYYDSILYQYENLANSMVVSCDYGGSIRVFLRKSCLDYLYFTAGPNGPLVTRSIVSSATTS
eukprot:CAMPEP_0178979084 /NCGR_PEP_ID=MMETSP0789-20121207/25600_1 /TAXON_ID=3005 /ORGANISM="Rhizosolenia setigera, Strain CCMP 1694" /LENGTH=288 /DNA_ID=CAMNT_0020669059 /DNA_START=206 /DNA_END=1072 /DNA_ORIENTATION=-